MQRGPWIIQALEVEKEEVQDHPQLQNQLEASLGYMKPCLKTNKYSHWINLKVSCCTAAIQFSLNFPIKSKPKNSNLKK